MASPKVKKAEEQAMARKKNQQVQSKKKTYTTKSGDSIGDIARMLGTTVSKLKQVNQKLANVKTLPKGMRIKLPTGVTADNSAFSKEMKEQARVKLAPGGALRPVPSGNKGKGLSKLPKPVRNKMGFMNKGSLATKKKTKGAAKGGKGVIVVSIGIGKMKKSKKKTTKKKTTKKS
jgi:LysM repeat protein